MAKPTQQTDWQARMNGNTNRNGQPSETDRAMCEPACESRPLSASECDREPELHPEPDRPITFAPSEARAAEREAASPIPQSPPFGSSGTETDRDVRGRFTRGNLARLIVGVRSEIFWNAADSARREISRAVISDAGHAEGDAPRALTLAADSIAQSTLIRDSAFARMVESGGALSSAGRARRSFLVWLSAVDRLERNLRLVGLRRVPRSAQSFAEFLSNAAPADAAHDAPVAARTPPQDVSDEAADEDRGRQATLTRPHRNDDERDDQDEEAGHDGD